MNQKSVLIGALAELFGPDAVVQLEVRVPSEEEIDHLFGCCQREIEQAMKDGTTSAVVIPSTLCSCYIFDSTGSLTGTLLVRDEFYTYFAGTSGA